MTEVFTIESEDSGKRLDVYLTERLISHSRSQLKEKIEIVKLNGKKAKLGKHVKTGDIIEVVFREFAPNHIELKPEEMNLSILYEDENVLVLDKEQGVVVHPAAGNYSGTIVNGLLYYLGRAAGNFRTGIVHRLDKDTSGVLIVAKNSKTQEYLASQFKARTVGKEYVAITMGVPEQDRGTIETYIARDTTDRKKFHCTYGSGKLAKTFYKILSVYGNYSLIALYPKTGRTHQLRVHMKHLGTPILGDPVYGKKDTFFPDASLMLHAYKLKIKIPGCDEPVTFRAPIPNRIKSILKNLHDIKVSL